MSQYQPMFTHMQAKIGQLHTSTPTLSYDNLTALRESAAQPGSYWHDRVADGQEQAQDTIESLPSASGYECGALAKEYIEQTRQASQLQERVLHLLLNAERLAFPQTPISQCFWEAFFTRYIQEWLHDKDLYLYQLPIQLKHDYQFSQARLHAFFDVLARLHVRAGLSLQMHIPAEYTQKRTEIMATTSRVSRRKKHEDPTEELLTIHAKKHRTPPPLSGRENTAGNISHRRLRVQ